MLCATLQYHFFHLKNVKSTHGGVLLFRVSYFRPWDARREGSHGFSLLRLMHKKAWHKGDNDHEDSFVTGCIDRSFKKSQSISATRKHGPKLFHTCLQFLKNSYGYLTENYVTIFEALQNRVEKILELIFIIVLDLVTNAGIKYLQNRQQQHEALWAISYHLHKLKNVKNTHGRVLLLVKVTFHHRCFSCKASKF